MVLFEYNNYREYLRKIIEQNRHIKGYHTKLALAAGCQLSYLSLVLREKVHMTPEQALELSQYLNHTELEKEYFLCLVLFERSSRKTLKNHYSKKLKYLKQESDDLSNHFKINLLGDDKNLEFYYSSWHWAAIHLCCGIPQFQNIQAISKRLGLDLKFVKTSLERLLKAGFVTKRGNQWEITAGNIHLPKNSPFFSVNHSNWLNKTQVKLQQKDDGVHYTSIHTLSLKDFEKFKAIILNCISETRELVGPSPPEELICFSCDVYKV